jgi:hypothetical protein
MENINETITLLSDTPLNKLIALAFFCILGLLGYALYLISLTLKNQNR